MGCVDDVINVLGYRMGLVEVESALVVHDKVVEVAVVGFFYEIKGQGIYVYVILNMGEVYMDDLKKELIGYVRKEIGFIVFFDVIYWVFGLLKTCLGKIMCWIFRKIAVNDMDDLGDTLMFVEFVVVD